MRCLLVGVYFVVAMALAAPTCFGDDAAIARKVAEKLRFQQEQDALQGFHITVKVEDGTVWMMGDVADTEQRDLALDAARRVNGVRLVVNDLDIASEATANRSAGAAPEVEKTVAADRAVPQQAQIDQTFVRQAAAVAQMAPQPRPQVMHGNQPRPQVMHSNPIGSGVAQYSAPAAQHYPVHVAQNSVAPCYDGSSHAGTAGGSYYGGETVYEGGGNAMTSGQPQMPNYAWPSYASYPNYGAVAYPQQYSPSAWPYIGPFYPYPQVPLGWRKVALEWDDGWWMLDFSSK